MATDVSQQDRLAFIVEAIDGRRFKMVIKGDLHKLQVEKIRRYLKTNGVPDDHQIMYDGKIIRDDMTGEDFGLVPDSVLKMVAPHKGGMSPRVATNGRSGSQQSAHNVPQNYSQAGAGGLRALASNTSQVADGSSPSNVRGTSPQNQYSGRSAQEVEARLRQLQQQHSDFSTNYGGQSPAGSMQARKEPQPSANTQPPSSASYFDPVAHERQLRMQRMTGMGTLGGNGPISEAPSGIQYSSANVSFGSNQYPSLGGSPAKMGAGGHSSVPVSQTAVSYEAAANRFSQPKDNTISKLENENDQLRRQVEQLKLELLRKRQEHPPGDDLMANAKANLLELSKDLGIHLSFDQNLTCVIGNDERNTILITYDAATERLYLYSAVLTVLPRSEAAKLRLYEALLDGAMLGRDMAGGGIGMSSQNNIVMMSTSLSLRNSSQYTLRDIAPAFLDALNRWRSVAAEITSGQL